MSDMPEQKREERFFFLSSMEGRRLRGEGGEGWGGVSGFSLLFLSVMPESSQRGWGDRGGGGRRGDAVL